MSDDQEYKPVNAAGDIGQADGYTVSHEGTEGGAGDQNHPADMSDEEKHRLSMVDVDQKVADLESRVQELEAEKSDLTAQVAEWRAKHDDADQSRAIALQQNDELKTRITDMETASAAPDRLVLGAGYDSAMTAVLDDHLADETVSHTHSTMLASIRQSAVELRAKIAGYAKVAGDDFEGSRLAAALHKIHSGI